MANFQIGSIGEFDPSKERLNAYLERLDGYFEANRIGLVADDADAATKAAADKDKVNSLIAIIGPTGYETMQNQCKPNKPNTKTFDQLVVILKSHYVKTKLEIAESFKFHHIRQRKTSEKIEKISEYVGRLRAAAATCNFGNFLPRALRDQFVVGLCSSDDQTELMTKDRNFEECIQLATAMEAARGQVKDIQELQKQAYQSPVHSAEVHAVKHSSYRSHKKSSSGRSRHSSKDYDKDSAKTYKCFSCGKSSHRRSECKFRDAVCHKCSVKGHIASICKSKLKSVHAVDPYNSGSEYSESEMLFLDVHTMTETNSQISVPLKLQGNDVQMQLDTGCALSLAPKSFVDKHCSDVPITPTDVVMTTYSGEKLYPLGSMNVSIDYDGKQYSLPLIVLNEGVTPLFGRNWLSTVKLNWKCLPGIHFIRPSTTENCELPDIAESSVDEVLQRYDSLFQNRLGCYKGTPVNLDVDEMPRFHKARPVPYALQGKVEAALKQMEDDGVLKRVTSSPCAAPIVPVAKKESEIVRICGDFSVTYNKCASLYQYPIPKIEDLHAALRGCKIFSVLDFSQAYHQIPLSPECQQYFTINTHVGLFSFQRLPNGVHSGPGVFQQILDSTLAGIPKVICYLDDILVAGVDHADHMKTLAVVFQRLLDAGFQLNKAKCKLEKKAVTYLGHIIDSEGLHPTSDKLSAILDAPPPKDESALRSFLGLMMFYSRFLPNHSTVLAPLNRLLKKNVRWQWTVVEENAFADAKKMLVESSTLVHYDERLPLFLSCDASSYGAGAVLCHRIDGVDRPVAFASVTLTDAQKNYSQLDKEAFGIIFGLKRFHQFLAGRKFTIITDHKPLLHLLDPDRPTPLQCSARVKRWKLILSSYKYTLDYRSTKLHLDSDGLSRLPLPKSWAPKSSNVECHFFEDEIVTSVTHDMIKRHTKKDPVLSKVFRYTMNGWPAVVDPDLVPYKSRMLELSIEQGCLLWGSRVIIPRSLRKAVLSELHETHPGMSKMKMLARSYVWWSGMDREIEEKVSNCNICQMMRNDPPTSQVHPWIFPNKPWSRLHIDYAGPVGGNMYLVVVDAYSKYPEVVKMSSTTSEATIRALREMFSRHGLPEVLVSDNGPQFVSGEFEEFCKANGIAHRTSAIYKPATNGQAERVVQILKNALKQAKLTRGHVDDVVARYLLTYRNTPHCTTGESPAMLLMGRRLRTRLDLMIPNVREHVEQKQETMISHSADRGCRIFVEGESVLARNYSGDKWITGEIDEVLGHKHYHVKLENGQIVKRHVDQLLKSSRVSDKHVSSDVKFKFESNVPSGEDMIVKCPISLRSSNDMHEHVGNDVVTDVTSNVGHDVQRSVPVSTDAGGQKGNVKIDVKSTQSPVPRRVSSRVSRPPQHFKDYVTK